MVYQDVDEAEFGDFDALVAEKLITQWGGEQTRRIISSMIKRRVPADAIVSRFLTLLPTWEGHAEQLRVIVNYLAKGAS